MKSQLLKMAHWLPCLASLLLSGVLVPVTSLLVSTAVAFSLQSWFLPPAPECLWQWHSGLAEHR